MGLDMYLNAKRYLWSNEADISALVSQVFPELKERKVTEVVVEAMYWRKSNQIHKWFVDNIQNGVDDCGNYEVSPDDLKRLRDLICQVLAERKPELLPPQSGFFFGSSQVDDWYWQDLERTYDELGQVLDEFPGNWHFEYHSSW